MKSISCKNDLVIYGASKPAFEQPLHVGLPSTGDRDAFLARASDILDRNILTNYGPLVRQLEEEVARFHEVKHCVVLSSGTTALLLAICALELEGEVILPAFTFPATAHALAWQGIKPVFCDIDPGTHNIDPASAEACITPRTTGIIGVHLWGRPAAIFELTEITERHQLHLLFDAAHAFGNKYKGTPIGNFGDCEVLSFHATKYFHTFEGGAVLTNNKSLAEAIRSMSNFGFYGYDFTAGVGINGKLPEISAAMGLTNLNSLPSILRANKRNHVDYCQALANIPELQVMEFDDVEEGNFQYIIVELVNDCTVTRDSIVTALHGENVLARRYFWPGCHKLEPYKSSREAPPNSLPNTDLVAGRVFSLPSGPSIGKREISMIARILQVLLNGD